MKLAIVGCGAVFQRIHGPAIRRLHNRRIVEVAALVDPAPELLQLAASQYPGASAHTRLEDALRERVDAVLVLSPPSTHAEAIQSAVAAGVAVLCEKPLAESAEAARVLATSESHASQVRIAMLRRHFDTYRLVEHHKNELIGEVIGLLLSPIQRVIGALQNKDAAKAPEAAKEAPVAEAAPAVEAIAAPEAPVAETPAADIAPETPAAEAPSTETTDEAPKAE